MKKYFVLKTVLLASLWLALAAFPAWAQNEPGLTLRMSRDFGYSSGTGQIEGTFSLKASAPEDLARVVFFIDGHPLGEDSQAPFSLQFHTGSYSLGLHSLSATGTTLDGVELQSQEIKVEFVSADQGLKAAGRIAIPIIGISLGLMLLAIILPVLLGRGKRKSTPPGARRSYGLFGGAICPKCARPFPLQLWGLNLLVGRLEHCPHCGKFSLVHRASPDMLRQAELAELDSSGESDAGPAVSEEERLQKELDNSRFQDL